MSAHRSLSGEPARFTGGLRQVAPRTWAWLQPNGGLGESNAGLVCGDGAALLVDTLWDERLTRLMLGAMRAESPPRALAAMRTAAGAAGLLPGRVGAVARRGHAMLAPFDFGGVRRRYADRLLDDGEESSLDVGGREVRVRSLGPTHTASDAIAWVPDVRVAFCADLLFVGVAPVMWHGPVETWLAALDALLALDASVYVPGHGPPCGRAEVQELRAYWAWLAEGVRAQRAAGRDAATAARELVRSPEHARWAAWQAPERIAINVATMYRNLDGGPPEVAPPERARLLLRTVALGHELAGADG